MNPCYTLDVLRLRGVKTEFQSIEHRRMYPNCIPLTISNNFFFETIFTGCNYYRI